MEKGLVISGGEMVNSTIGREYAHGGMVENIAVGQGFEPEVSPIGHQKMHQQHYTPVTSAAMMHGGGGGGGVNRSNVNSGMYKYLPMMQTGMDPVTMSPTQLAPPSHYLPPHLPPGITPDQAMAAAALAAANQHHLPYHTALSMHSPDQLPASQTPGTPTLSHQMPLPTQQAAAQGLFTPPTSLAHSPVQILGHRLSTSIFSPPPSAAPAHMFMNPIGAVGAKPSPHSNHSPSHAPVGSGSRLGRYDTSMGRSDMSFAATAAHNAAVGNNGRGVANGSLLQQKQGVITGAHSSGSDLPEAINGGGLYHSQQLPPRLGPRAGGGAAGGGGGVSGGGAVSGTRYQNQRHPSNRPMSKAESTTPYIPPRSGVVAGGKRKEPLLPTPNEMIKLDIGITG